MTGLWHGCGTSCPVLGQRRRGMLLASTRRRIPFGRMHVVVALDLEQLPLSTSTHPFIDEYLDCQKVFEFLVLHQHRRLAVGSTEDETEMSDTFRCVLE